jgi:hypothetical protein
MRWRRAVDIAARLAQARTSCQLNHQVSTPNKHDQQTHDACAACTAQRDCRVVVVAVPVVGTAYAWQTNGPQYTKANINKRCSPDVPSRVICSYHQTAPPLNVQQARGARALLCYVRLRGAMLVCVVMCHVTNRRYNKAAWNRSSSRATHQNW